MPQGVIIGYGITNQAPVVIIVASFTYRAWGDLERGVPLIKITYLNAAQPRHNPVGGGGA